MEDYNLQQAEQRNKEIDHYYTWLETNECNIIDCYIDSIDSIESVPDDFIQSLYEKYCEDQ